jgi:hypothetical protein
MFGYMSWGKEGLVRLATIIQGREKREHSFNGVQKGFSASRRALQLAGGIIRKGKILVALGYNYCSNFLFLLLRYFEDLRSTCDTTRGGVICRCTCIQPVRSACRQDNYASGRGVGCVRLTSRSTRACPHFDTVIRFSCTPYTRPALKLSPLCQSPVFFFVVCLSTGWRQPPPTAWSQTQRDSDPPPRIAVILAGDFSGHQS